MITLETEVKTSLSGPVRVRAVNGLVEEKAVGPGGWYRRLFLYPEEAIELGKQLVAAGEAAAIDRATVAGEADGEDRG